MPLQLLLLLACGSLWRRSARQPRVEGAGASFGEARRCATRAAAVQAGGGSGRPRPFA